MKSVATILSLIAVSFGLSWCAVYSYWLAAFIFQSVLAVRIADQIAALILIPARVLFWLSRDVPETPIQLVDPLRYAGINALLLSLLAYLVLRRRIFKAGP